MARSKGVRVGFRLDHLPLEIVLEILSYTASSASVYRTLLLVSKPLNALVKLDCLPVVPVVLEEIKQLRSFNRFLQSTPKARTYVRHLWIQGDGLESWRLIDSIVVCCSSITSLSCTSRTLAALCNSPTFCHRGCTELSLIEPAQDWKSILDTAHGSDFCLQTTHLRVQEGLDPEFPKRHFTNLTHLAFSCNPIGDFLRSYLKKLSSLPSLRFIVATTLPWRYGTHDSLATELMELDKRLAVFHCHGGWTELDAWKGRVRGGRGLWEQARVSRQSMLVFRHAFKILQE